MPSSSDYALQPECRHLLQRISGPASMPSSSGYALRWSTWSQSSTRFYALCIGLRIATVTFRTARDLGELYGPRAPLSRPPRFRSPGDH
jgi:hypothetical protein